MVKPVYRYEDPARDERITVRFSRGRWGAVPEHLIEDPRLSDPAKLLAIWLCIRPDGWVVVRTHVMRALRFGRDRWQSARRQLLECGYLTAQTGRMEDGRFVAPKLDFDAYPSLPLVTGTGLPGSGEAGAGSSGAGPAGARQSGSLPIPSVPTPSVPTPPPQPRVVVEKQAMGDRLAEVLGNDPRVVARVNQAAAAASSDQVGLAVDVVRGLVAAGRAKNPVGLALKLAQAASLGAVSPPQRSPEDSEATRRMRAEAVGRYVVHPRHGRHKVIDDGRAWEREKDKQIVAGPPGLKLWRMVEAGELQLEP